MRDALGHVQSILVLGGTSEIGIATALALAPGRANNVVLTEREPGSADSAVARLRNAGVADVRVGAVRRAGHRIARQGRREHLRGAR